MPFFEYIATNKEQDEISGLVEAANDQVALGTLTEQGLLVLSLKEQIEERGVSIDLSFLNRIKSKDLVVFSRQLAVMVSATMPLVRALRILVRQTENVNLKIVVSELMDAVEGGTRFSDALAKYPKVFSNFYISMVRSGETAGKLEEVLGYLADQQEKDYELMSKVKGAMIYPSFILFGLLIVGIIMMVFVVPKMTEILEESGTEVPFATKALIWISSFLTNYWWLMVIILAGAAVGFMYYRRSKLGREQTDYLLLKMPIFGKVLFQKLYLVRFTRSLSTLITGGVSLTEALRISSEVVGNQVYKRLIEDTIEEVEDGNSIATVFLQEPVVPPMVSQMFVVGEQTGRIDLVLNKLSDFYAREIDVAVGNLVSLIEPLVLMIMGAAVGLMVASILLPIYNLASAA